MQIVRNFELRDILFQHKKSPENIPQISIIIFIRLAGIWIGVLL